MRRIITTISLRLAGILTGRSYTGQHRAPEAIEP